MSRAQVLAVALFLLLPAARAAAIRLIERNGEHEIEYVVAGVQIPSNGVVVITPDRIFHSGFGR